MSNGQDDVPTEGGGLQTAATAQDTGVQDAQKGTQLCSRSGAHIPFLGAKSEARK